MKSLLTFILLGVLPALSQAQVLKLKPKDYPEGYECYRVPSIIRQSQTRYCTYHTHPELKQSGKESLMLFFHGIYNNADLFVINGYLKAFQDLQKTKSIKPTMIVAIDTDYTSFFGDAGGKIQGKRAFESWMIKELIPYVETTHNLCSKRECRSVLGESMGGFGSLKTVLKYPEIFSGVAAISPALAAFDIHDDWKKWWGYFSNQPVGPMIGMFVLQKVREVFPTRKLSSENDPLQIVQNWDDSRPKPYIYIDVGGADTYGFQNGYKKFVQTVLDHGGFQMDHFLIPGADHDFHIKLRAPIALEHLLSH